MKPNKKEFDYFLTLKDQCYEILHLTVIPHPVFKISKLKNIGKYAKLSLTRQCQRHRGEGVG